MRLIDADAFKAYMQDKYVLFDNTLADIDAQPTVDAEPVRHGHWERVNGRDYWRCSCCYKENRYAYSHNDTLLVLQDSYCPNCGAKMDEVTE